MQWKKSREHELRPCLLENIGGQEENDHIHKELDDPHHIIAFSTSPWGEPLLGDFSLSPCAEAISNTSSLGMPTRTSTILFLRGWASERHHPELVGCAGLRLYPQTCWMGIFIVIRSSSDKFERHGSRLHVWASAAVQGPRRERDTVGHISKDWSLYSTEVCIFFNDLLLLQVNDALNKNNNRSNSTHLSSTHSTPGSVISHWYLTERSDDL